MSAPQSETPRLDALERYEGLFYAVEYESCRFDFDGRALPGASGSPLPDHGGGLYVEQGRDVVPYAKRRPLAPSRLGRTIVHRFTAELFATGNQPAFRVLGDPDLNDWVQGLLEACDWWQKMVEGRNKGGSMGTAVLSWAVHQGHPVVEVHNPKHVTPRWLDRARCLLHSIVISFRFERVERDDRGVQRSRTYIYRRVIDQEHDTLYTPWPDDEGRPTWEGREQKVHAHHFGRCPVVWVQNTPDSDAIDGEADYFGQLEAIESYDRQVSHALRATGKNCDPTLVITLGVGQQKTDKPVDKGSDHAIQLSNGGSAGYAEMTGAGVTHARDNAAMLKASILEACDCVLDSQSTTDLTATEVHDRRAAMNARVDLLRGQYGPAMVDMVEMMIAYAKRMDEIEFVPEFDESELDEDEDEGAAQDADEEGELPPQGPPKLIARRRTLIIPPKVIEDPEDPTKPAQIVDRTLGTAERWLVRLQWPDHSQHSPEQVISWQTALGAAEDRGWIDSETAALKWAGIADIDSAREAFVKAQRSKSERDAAAAQREAEQMERMLAGLEGKGAPPAEADDKADTDDDSTEPEADAA